MAKYKVAEDFSVASEVLMFAENDYKLYQRLMNVLKNLESKKKRGVYDKQKAVKGVITMYINPAIKEYRNTFGLGPVNQLTKEYMARETLDVLNDDYGLDKVKKSK